jgi:hypothetical protein
MNSGTKLKLHHLPLEFRILRNQEKILPLLPHRHQDGLKEERKSTNRQELNSNELIYEDFCQIRISPALSTVEKI